MYFIEETLISSGGKKASYPGKSKAGGGVRMEEDDPSGTTFNCSAAEQLEEPADGGRQANAGAHTYIRTHIKMNKRVVSTVVSN